MRTKDLYFASYLVAREYALTDIDRSTPRNVYFVFEISEEDEKRERLAWMGSGTIEARRYADSIKSLKALVH